MDDAGIKEIVTTLAEGLDVSDPSTVELNDGRTVTARMHYDDSSDLFDGDGFGKVTPVKSNYTIYPDTRPDGYDGRARKVHTRDDTFWWQPCEYIPADAIDDTYRVVRDWLNGDWQYIGLTVEIGDAHAGLWGIDMSGSYSDNLRYIAETLSELLSEALADPTANVCPCCKRDYDA